MWLLRAPVGAFSASSVSLVRRGAPSQRSPSCDCPGPAVMGEPKGGEARQVHCGSASKGVGEDAPAPAYPRLAPAPRPAREVGDLALDRGPVGAVALAPPGRGLLGARGLQQRLVLADG